MTIIGAEFKKDNKNIKRSLKSININKVENNTVDLPRYYVIVLVLLLPIESIFESVVKRIKVYFGRFIDIRL